MIGKICKASTPFYDNIRKCMSYKIRPALVLAKADTDDYVILPISTISHKYNIDPIYDIEIDPKIYPRLNLARISYIRTHKQTIVHCASLVGVISDIRSEYEDLYLDVLEKGSSSAERLQSRQYENLYRMLMKLAVNYNERPPVVYARFRQISKFWRS